MKFVTSLVGAIALFLLILSGATPAKAATTSHAVATVTASTLVASTPAASMHRHRPLRLEALQFARHQHGRWYCYGGTGPSCFDCSGLVMEAYRHAGVRLPRTTYEMMDSWHLVRVSHPRRGDIAFFGPGHVELFLHGGWNYGVTFGAHDSGRLIGRIHYNRRWGWAPTAFYRVRKR